MQKTASDRIALRGRVYYYVRRVPKRFEKIDSRGIVFISLNTEDRPRAEETAIAVEKSLEADWSAKAAFGDPDAWARHGANVERARLEGFVYRSAGDIAKELYADRVARMLALEGREEDRSAVTAVAGGSGGAFVSARRRL